MADPGIVTCLSLCAGIGGLELGIDAALGGRLRVVGYVEREAFAAATLLARMEDEGLEPAPVWAGNLEDCDYAPFAGNVDLVTAGFPCQPWSSAGKREGTADERWIWPGIVRVIRDVRPRWVFLENVPGLVSGGGIQPVLGGLAVLGYDAEWDRIAAGDVGAPHQRQRVFILGRLADTGNPVERNGRQGRREGRRADAGGAARTWPTPDASADSYRLQGDSQQSKSLEPIARSWPTPSSADGGRASDPGTGRDGGASLTEASGAWSTPRAADSAGVAYQRDRGTKGLERPSLTGEAQDFSLPELPTGTCGPECSPRHRRLNPLFASWLMGLPPYWTDARTGSGRSAMLWCLYRRLLRSEFSRIVQAGGFE